MPQTPNAVATCKAAVEAGALRIALSGRLDADGAATVWDEAVRAARGHSGELIVDCGELEYCDGAGAAVLIELQRIAMQREQSVRIERFPEEYQRLLNLFELRHFLQDEKVEPQATNFVVDIGRATANLLTDLYNGVSYRGELAVELWRALRHPRQTRWGEALLLAEKAGANAMPLVALIGFLLGLILAFQAGAFMKEYGAELYVANLVGLSLLRELGPLMSAIILAGRTGSAFAAEIGTMKVNEELDALHTMGVNPVRYLVVPRVIAAVCVMPFLVMFANLFGLIGGGVVVLSFDYPLITYYNQLFTSVAAMDLSDLLTGMFKAVVFGLLVSAVGCLRGLQTKSGASAVGDAATSAVVTGIVLIAIWDGIFTALFYALDI
ncbi:MlaE family lipid ABC transporter permease subunit [Candidatus Sumerlaeota bacterium]|nr:MlaE family lipid ABC transporter permease subunit [Candidatus Sumerlaeota bacterium]